jgi:hypothetical protein
MILKPCPLCPHSTFVELFPEWLPEDDRQGFKVACGGCGCHTNFFWTEVDAIKFWNTRKKHINDLNCPFCNNFVPLSEYKISLKQNDPFFQHLCQCGFNSGLSKNKKLIINTWTNRKKY